MAEEVLKSPELQLAERTKLEAEAEQARAQAALHSASAVKMRAEADKAQMEAEHARLQFQLAQREFNAVMARDENNFVYNFRGAVTSASVTAAISKLTEWSRVAPGADITVVIDSPGGSVIDGMDLWDFLTGIKQHHHLTTVCRGYSASMAGILLQSGTVRQMGRESYLMIHELSSTTGGKIGEIKDEVKFYERVSERIVDIFVERSGGKCSKARFIRSWTRTDWWLDSEEALKLGFVDEII